MTHFELRLLGLPTLLRDGAVVDLERRHAMALLAYLATQTDGAHTCLRRDDLAAVFWPNHSQEHARSSLRRTLAVLTRVFAGAILTADRETICLRRSTPGSDLRIDVEHFRSLLSRCRHYGHPTESICEQCLLPLVESAALYRGDFMAGFTITDDLAFDDWQREQSDNLRCELAGVLAKLVAGMMERRGYQQAIGYAQRWVALDPLHEPAQRKLMQLYAQVGQPQLALRQYRECHEALHRELGALPQAETVALYEAIRNNRTTVPALLLARSTTSAHVRADLSTYQTPHDAASLVGRDQGMAVSLGEWERVRRGDVRLLLVTGEPGIGRTHFVQALSHFVSSQECAILTSRCDADGASSLAPVADWIRQAVRAGVVANLPDVLSPDVRDDLVTLCPELSFHAPHAHSSRAESAPVDVVRLWASAYACLDQLTRGGEIPLLALVDDAQWASDETLHFLRYLVQRAQVEHLRLLLVLTSPEGALAPEDSRELFDLLATLRRAHAVTEIRLGRLNREETRALMAHLLQGQEPTPRAVDAVFEWGEGVPFFTVELASSIAVDAAAQPSGMALEQEGTLPLACPGSVRAWVLARMGRLPEAAQRVLRIAALVEGHFLPEVILRACDLEEEDFVAALESATRAQFLREESQDSQLRYTFAHAQTAPIVRASMSSLRRRFWARRIAEAEEALRGETP